MQQPDQEHQVAICWPTHYNRRTLQRTSSRLSITSLHPISQCSSSQEASHPRPHFRDIINLPHLNQCTLPPIIIIACTQWETSSNPILILIINIQSSLYTNLTNINMLLVTETKQLLLILTEVKR